MYQQGRDDMARSYRQQGTPYGRARGPPRGPPHGRHRYHGRDGYGGPRPSQYFHSGRTLSPRPPRHEPSYNRREHYFNERPRHDEQQILKRRRMDSDWPEAHRKQRRSGFSDGPNSPPEHRPPDNRYDHRPRDYRPEPLGSTQYIRPDQESHARSRQDTIPPEKTQAVKVNPLFADRIDLALRQIDLEALIQWHSEDSRLRSITDAANAAEKRIDAAKPTLDALLEPFLLELEAHRPSS